MVTNKEKHNTEVSCQKFNYSECTRLLFVNYSRSCPRNSGENTGVSVGNSAPQYNFR